VARNKNIRKESLGNIRGARTKNITEQEKKPSKIGAEKPHIEN